jgi:hypothetical protein
MSAGPQRAGAATLADGTTVVWSVAEGRRGRRWREVRSGPEGVISSLLLETDAARRFAHIELATAAGLLTLHPEGDGTLHGNVVGVDGVRHVVGRPWDERGAVLVDGSPIAAAAAAWSAIGHGGGPDGESESSLRVTLGLELEAGAVAAATIDREGLPELADGATWPLEIGSS